MPDNNVAYGFMQLEDVFNRRVKELDAAIIDTAVYDSAAAYTRDFDALVTALVLPTTIFQERYELPTSGELQPMSQNGTPIPTRGYKSVLNGYPLMRGADSFGLNREGYAKLTVREMNKMMLNVQSKDARWNIRRILAAIFTNVSWTYNNEDDKQGPVTVRSLAVTGDGAIYMDYGGALVTANHYTAQASAIDNSNNPFTAQATILKSHPGNMGTIVSYIPTNLVESTQALAAFHAFRGDTPLVDYGSDVTLANDVVGEFLGFGKSVLGEVSDNVIVETPLIPSNYIVSVVMGPGMDKPIAMRQEPEADLQGLQVVPFQVDSNFRKWDFYRKAGYGVRNPIAVAVRRIGNASYAIPTGYDARTLPG
jgi:hypothetical protein